MRRIKNLKISNLLTILTLLVLSQTVAGQDIFQRPDGLYVTSDISARLGSVPRDRLVIQAASALTGSIKIVSAEQSHVDISYVKQARTPDRGRAYDYIDLISLNLYSSPEESRIVMRAPNPAPWTDLNEAGLLTATITVPLNCHLEIEAERFDIDAVGPLASVVVPQSFGQLSVSRVSGVVDLNTANRRIFLDNVSGHISASTSNEDILARSLIADSSSARFSNEKGEIRVIDISGSLNVRNRLGSINISDWKLSGENSFISGSSEPILIEVSSIAEGQLVVSNRYEDIEITVPRDISAYFALSVDDGNIETSNLPVRTELVQSNRLNVVAGNGDVDIRGSIRGNGNILLTGIE